MLGFFLIHFFSGDIDPPYFAGMLIFPLIFAFHSSIPLTSSVTSLYFHRVSTKDFIYDLLRNIFIFWVIFLITSILGALYFIPIFFKESFLSLGFSYIFPIFFMIYLLFLNLTIMTSAHIKGTLSSAENIGIKALFYSIATGSLGGLLVFIIMISFSVGCLLITFFLLSLIINNLFTKTFLNKSYRIKFFIFTITISSIVLLFFTSYELYKGNKNYIFSTAGQRLWENQKLRAIKVTSQDQVHDLKTWFIWTKQNSLKPHEFAQSFILLEQFCPPQKRLDMTVIECNSCIQDHRWISSKIFNESDDARKNELTQHLLLENESEYSNMLGLLFYANLREPSSEMIDKVQKIAHTKSHPLALWAQNVLNNKDTLNKTFHFLVRTVQDQDECNKPTKR
ncbi:MAG: hypothetical protein M9899_05685 [Bdellovibrionaceae bacterium]|nr:hypothetical protein [Pseudobdellovibrionaceae bacterium]